MPLYEYQCQKCGHHLESLQKVADSPLTQCPKCGKNGLVRAVSLSRFKLKGTGWYETDFKKKPAGKEDKSKRSDDYKKSMTQKKEDKA